MRFTFFGQSKKPAPDERVLIQLRKAGSDLSKPHAIEFFLYFPTHAVAEQAATHIRKVGFQVEVRAAPTGSDWLAFTTRTMVPNLGALQEIRRDFTALAASLNGEYDGWGTPIVK